MLCGIPLWLTGTALGIMFMCVCARRIKSVELFEKKEAQYTTRIEGLMRERESARKRRNLSCTGTESSALHTLLISEKNNNCRTRIFITAAAAVVVLYILGGTCDG